MNITTEYITCQECGKSFSERSVFNKHFRQYHKKNESDCLVCGRKFFDNHPNFNHKDKSTDKYGKAVLTAVVHFNSNNLGSVQ